MPFNRLAVYGHRGWASSAIVRGLASSGAPLKILLRPSSNAEGLPPNAVPIITNLDDQPSLVAALQNVDILISLVGHEGVKRQEKLVEAIPKTGVKLFVPSDLGFELDEQGLRIPVLRAKQDVLNLAKMLSIPTTTILPGCLAEPTFNTAMLGVDYEGNRIVYTGDSDREPCNICTREYVAAAYASLFPSTPISDLQNRTIGLSEMYVAGNEIAAALHKKHGSAPQILTQSLASVDQEIELCLERGSPLALGWYCRRVWGAGQLVKAVGRDIWSVPGYRKMTLEELLMDGKLSVYRDLPPQVLALFEGMLGKAAG